MRIFFNKNHENCLDVLKYIAAQITEIENIRYSSMENSWNFTFQACDFYIQYDENSRKNKQISQFVIISHAADAGEEDESSKEAVESLLYKMEVIEELEELFLDDDER
jgi:hypothetical protein